MNKLIYSLSNSAWRFPFGVRGCVLAILCVLCAIAPGHAQNSISVTPYCHDDGTTQVDVSHVKIITLGRQGATSFFWMNPETGAQIAAPPSAELTRGYCNGATATDTAAVARLDRIIDSLAAIHVSIDVLESETILQGDTLDAISDNIRDQTTIISDSLSAIIQNSEPESWTVETYWLDGSLSATATPSTDGNTVTITAPYKSLGFRFIRPTPEDAGSGLTASVTVNDGSATRTYYPGGQPYRSDGWILEGGNGTYSTNYTFTTTGSAEVEIKVIR